MHRLAAFLLVTSLSLAGCSTPCDRLGARADDCGYAESRHVDDRRSICTSTREELGEADFDAFADCVLATNCNDGGSVARCEEQHVGARGDSCRDLKLWASACGLEPVGTDDECDNLRTGLTATTFDEWVACVTADGCPIPDDPRYDVCQDVILDPGAATVIDACVIVSEWTERCADEAPDFFPVTETSVPACIAEAQPFYPSSYMEYALCLRDLPCDSVAERLDCILNLRFIDPSNVTASCQRLINYAATCDSPIGGGSVEACERIFVGFTPESFAAYVDCVEARDCDDTTAALECGALLQLQQ